MIDFVQFTYWSNTVNHVGSFRVLIPRDGVVFIKEATYPKTENGFGSRREKGTEIKWLIGGALAPIERSVTVEQGYDDVATALTVEGAVRGVCTCEDDGMSCGCTTFPDGSACPCPEHT